MVGLGGHWAGSIGSRRADASNRGYPGGLRSPGVTIGGEAGGSIASPIGRRSSTGIRRRPRGRGESFSPRSPGPANMFCRSIFHIRRRGSSRPTAHGSGTSLCDKQYLLGILRLALVWAESFGRAACVELHHGLHHMVRQTRRAARIDSNVKNTEQVRSPCAELAAQYSHSTPTPTAVRPSLPASP